GLRKAGNQETRETELHVGSAARRFVREKRTEPALDRLHRLPLPARVARHLVLSDSPDTEISCLRMCEIEAADAGGWEQGRMSGELDASLRRIEEIEQLELLAVIGAGRISESGTNAPVMLGDHIIGCD